MLEVGIIGAGKLAWHLAAGLENGGATVGQLWARDSRQAKALQQRCYQATIVNQPAELAEAGLDAIFLCVADEAIETLSEQLGPTASVVIHCSGASALSLIQQEHAAVLWPIQTFRKEAEVVWKQVPLMLQGSNKHALKTVKTLAKGLGGKAIQSTGDEQRLKVHLAASLSANLSNLLWREAAELLAEEKLDFSLLASLLKSQLSNALAQGPDNAQTGPALREDLATLDRHMRLLGGDDALAELYQLLSQRIIDKNEE